MAVRGMRLDGIGGPDNARSRKFGPRMPLSSPARHLPASEFARRVKGLRAHQSRLALDAVLVITEVNRYYFTGLQASNGVLLLAAAPAFHTDFRYLAVARKRLPSLAVRPLWRPADEQETLAKMGRGWRRVGYEGAMAAARFGALRDALPQAEWVDISDVIGEMRSVKSVAEQRAVRNAARANDAVFADVRKHIREGMREWDVRNLIRRGMDAAGQGEAFDTIVCAGKNSAECHHHSDETAIRANRPVLIDMGVRLDHYCSDMTRSFCMGEPPPFYREVYGIVLEANRKAIRAIRPGRACAEIDAVARQHIAAAGYGKCFGHSLGHSLGLEVHESPSFAPTCETVLRPGMVLTVEPGIYFPGRFGIRIEDIILVTPTGCDVLSETERN